MSFLFETFEIPLWLLVFAFACAAPLWIKWYQMFYRKFIVTGVLQKNIKKAGDAVEEKANILKKATDNWNSSSEHELNTASTEKKKREHLVTEAEQPYVKIVLKILAINGDAGMLIQSIADKLEINSNEIKNSLLYLERNEFVDVIAAGNGTKYYLSARGKKYCVKRGYITE
ncbi:MAG: hypothetical protein KAT06_09480 [Gammaproteobacteria bacterium]|nr:hypothetical protein [Gammaproteobacteria bacterium]